MNRDSKGMRKQLVWIFLVMSATLVNIASADNTDALPDRGLHSSHLDDADALYFIPDVVQASQVNDNTVGIIFSPEDLFESAVQNLDAEVSAHDGPRLVPILGKNSVQNVYDLLYLKGVDVALIRSDAIEYVKTRGNFPTVSNVIKNLASVHEDKILILARSEISSMADLEGEKVAMGYYASGEYITATVLTDALGISVEPVYGSVDSTLEMLENGDVAAMVFLLHADDHEEDADHVDPPGLASIKELQASDNIKVLELPVDQALLNIYSQDSLTAVDLPEMIAEGESLTTYRVHTILAAYRWRSNNPRYTKTQNFINAFIDTTEHLKTGPQEEFWESLDMDLPVPGVDRLAQVDEVLAARQLQKEQLLIEARARQEARREAERVARLEKLTQQREVITQLINERIGDADLEELESLLGEINSFVERLGPQEQ